MFFNFIKIYKEPAFGFIIFLYFLFPFSLFLHVNSMGPSRPGGLPAPSRAPPKGGRGHAWWPSPGHLASREQGRGGGGASPAPGPPSVPKAGGGTVGAKSGRRGQTQRGAGWGRGVGSRDGAETGSGPAPTVPAPGGGRTDGQAGPGVYCTCSRTSLRLGKTGDRSAGHSAGERGGH